MRKPLDTTDGCAFALRVRYEDYVYVKNLLRGGAHFPATSVMEIYELPTKHRG